MCYVRCLLCEITNIHAKKKKKKKKRETDREKEEEEGYTGFSVIFLSSHFLKVYSQSGAVNGIKSCNARSQIRLHDPNNKNFHVERLLRDNYYQVSSNNCEKTKTRF